MFQLVYVWIVVYNCNLDLANKNFTNRVSRGTARTGKDRQPWDRRVVAKPQKHATHMALRGRTSVKYGLSMAIVPWNQGKMLEGGFVSVGATALTVLPSESRIGATWCWNVVAPADSGFPPHKWMQDIFSPSSHILRCNVWLKISQIDVQTNAEKSSLGEAKARFYDRLYQFFVRTVLLYFQLSSHHRSHNP